MGGCATKLRQVAKAFEAEDKGEKLEPLVEVEVEEDKKAADDTEEKFKERVKEIVGEEENENEITVVDEIQGCKQRPSLSLLFKQEEEEVKDWAESEKPKNETKGKQEPILEAQEPEPTRPKEEDQQQHHDHDEQEIGKIIKEEQRDASEQNKSEDVVESFASQKV